MNSFDKNFLEQKGFQDFIRIGDFTLKKDIISGIPPLEGIYAVVSEQLPEKRFLKTGTGGYFKSKNPNVSEACLLDNWVEGTHILYIGKAGGIDKNGRKSDSTLRDRIHAYLKFGSGYKVGHWGGRLIWQLEKSEDLLIYRRACNGEENAVTLEKQLFLEFEEHYTKLPFANLKH